MCSGIDRDRPTVALGSELHLVDRDREVGDRAGRRENDQATQGRREAIDPRAGHLGAIVTPRQSWPVRELR